MDDTGLKGTDYVLRAFGLLLSNFGRVALSALLWLSPLVALQLWGMFGPGGMNDPETIQKLQQAMAAQQPGGIDWRAILLALAYQCFELALLSGFAVQRHRDILAQVMPMKRTLAASIPPFVGYWVVIVLLIQVFAGIGAFVLASVLNAAPFRIPGIVVFLLVAAIYVAFAFLVLRSSLVFPAIAVGDREMTLRMSFELTVRSVWRMLLSLILICIPFFLVALLFSMAMTLCIPSPMDAGGAFSPSTGFWIWALSFQIVGWTVLYLGTAVTVAYISLVYAHKRADAVPSPPRWDEDEASAG